MQFNLKKWILELGTLLIGNLLFAIAIGLFILPNNVLTGGVAGIAILLSPFVPLSETAIIWILSVGLLILGWVCLGNHFMVNTFISSFLYPALLMFIQENFLPPMIDPLLAAVFGGLIGGIGLGLVIKTGSSTGGMDIPPLIIHKYFGLDISKTMMCVDALTVLAGFLIYGLEAVLIGLISVYMSGVAIDKTITFGGNESKSVQIISHEYAAIKEDIHEILDRGTTMLEAYGGYTNKPRKVLLVVVSNREYSKLMDIVNKHDPNAFVIVSGVVDIHGNGFSDSSRI